MSSNSKFLGYWEPVTDEQSAWGATHMGGLLILLFGLNIILTIVIMFGNNSISATFAIAGVVLAIIMGVFAFRIKANKPASLPYLVALFLCFTVVTLIMSLAGNIMLIGLKAAAISFAVTLILPIIITTVALNGLSGWRSLKANKIAMKF